MLTAMRTPPVGNVPRPRVSCSVGHYHRRRNVLLPVQETDGAEEVCRKAAGTVETALTQEP